MIRDWVHRVGILVLAAILCVPSTASAQSQPIDLVEELATTLSAAAGGDGFAWDQVPDATTQVDELDDHFTIDGDTPTYTPPQGDLVQGDQFGFSYPNSVFSGLFGPDGLLDCARPEVACPTYDTSTKPFAKGTFVLGFQVGAPVEVSGSELLTVAVHAKDDDYPSVQDPRPNSPFAGTNKLWRMDLSASGDPVRYLQIEGGTFQEFHTDARVLLAGDHGWFFIPPAEYPLAHTIEGWDVEVFVIPSGDATAAEQAVDVLAGLGPRDLLIPIGIAGVMIIRPRDASPSASPSASSVPPSSPQGPVVVDVSKSKTKLLWFLVIALGLLLVLAAAWMWFFRRAADEGGIVIDGSKPPPVVVPEKKKVKRQRRVVVEAETQGILVYDPESMFKTIVVTEEVEEEVPPPAPIPAPTIQDPGPSSGGVEELPGPEEFPPPGVAIPTDETPLTPCAEEFLNWQAAETACREATRAAELSRQMARDAKAALDALRQEYPPLGFSEPDSPVIRTSDGMHMSDLDRALMDWDEKNRPQERRSSDPHEQLRRNKERLARVRAEYAKFKAKEAELEAKLTEAEAAAREAEARAKEACDVAAEAKAAYERCMGISTGAGAGVVDGGTSEGPKPAKPEPPKPEPPKPEPPKPQPPKPQPPKPQPPKPQPPKPSGGSGGGGESPGGCREGTTKETEVRNLVLEVPRRRGRATITVTPKGVGSLKFEGYPVAAFSDLTTWLGSMREETRASSSTYTFQVDIQFERIVAKCSKVQLCVNGSWGPAIQHREVADPVAINKPLAHGENLNLLELRIAVNKAIQAFYTADASREKLDTFCRD